MITTVFDLPGGVGVFNPTCYGRPPLMIANFGLGVVFDPWKDEITLVDGIKAKFRSVTLVVRLFEYV